MENVDLVTAFIAGLLSFLSPCVLPLVPAYIANLAGTTALDTRARASWVPTFIHSLFSRLGRHGYYSATGNAAHNWWDICYYPWPFPSPFLQDTLVEFREAHALQDRGETGLPPFAFDRFCLCRWLDALRGTYFRGNTDHGMELTVSGAGSTAAGHLFTGDGDTVYRNWPRLGQDNAAVEKH
jgi:hypothetical protein